MADAQAEVREILPGLDYIANFLNALDTEGMTANEVRSAVYSECLEPGCKSGLTRLSTQSWGEDDVERVLAAFNGGIVNVPDGSNSRGYVAYYRPKEAMRAALAALRSAPGNAFEQGGYVSNRNGSDVIETSPVPDFFAESAKNSPDYLRGIEDAARECEQVGADPGWHHMFRQGCSACASAIRNMAGGSQDDSY